MLEGILGVVLEIICGLTGSILLWAFTLGRGKGPDASASLPTVVGVVFWIAVVALAVALYQLL